MGGDIIGYEHKSMNKNIVYEKVGGIHSIGFEGNSGVKSIETRSYQKEKCNSPIFSTFEGICCLCANYIFPSDKTLFPCFLHHYCLQILLVYATNLLIMFYQP